MSLYFLQVLGISYSEELSLRPRDLTPPDPSPQPPPPSALPPNKRPKLSHESGTDIGTDASAHDSDMLDQQQEAGQARLGKEGEQASVSRVVKVHSTSLLRHVSGRRESGENQIFPPLLSCYCPGTTVSSLCALHEFLRHSDRRPFLNPCRFDMVRLHVGPYTCCSRRLPH